ncbi:MAG: hypothetical protein VKO21_00870 [Candidatus Sericytochromatia bacterium]|nr:hypothetical protein [Candidatus Sericytochromatia bacterium]
MRRVLLPAILALSAGLVACGRSPAALTGGGPGTAVQALAQPVRLLTPVVGTQREFNNYYSGEIDTWLMRAVGYKDLFQGQWGRAQFRVEETFYDEVSGMVGAHRVRLRVNNDWTLSGESRGAAVTGRFDGKWGAEATAHGRSVYFERFATQVEGRTDSGGRFLIQATLEASDIQLLGMLAVLLAGDPTRYADEAR